MTPSPLVLPKPSTTQLKDAPLQLVVCQVRHDRVAGPRHGDQVLAIRDALTTSMGEELGLEQLAQQEVAFEFSPSGVSPLPNSGPSNGWRLRSRDGKWLVALFPDFFALESTGYTSWSDFKTRLEALCGAVERIFQPTLEQRLGLRYVDSINHPAVSTPKQWAGYIEGSLLGPILHPQFGDAISGVQQVIHMPAPDEMQVLLRHGTQRDDSSGTWPYLLDTDCTRVSSRRFSCPEIVKGAGDLHELALQVFQASVTPELMRVLKGEGGFESN
ncbi:TIGR04255 family protein [Streptomyces sp. NPDC048349]|uniref:TIGR04255 family protein n=1 Tax=Streptomyces sp. NPDC048349 TaxID=3155486 RepID=UPI003417CE08